MPVPPVDDGTYQLKVTWLALVKASSRATFCGALETSHTGKTAFDTEFDDVAESPMTFVATTFAITLAELPSEKGAARRAVIGIVQVLLEVITPLEPSQFVVSSNQLRFQAWM